MNRNTKVNILFLATTFSLGMISQLVQAKDYVVEQKDKAFSVKTLKVKVGDTVTFRNEDPFNHNIFSLSDAKSFDLGSYPKGQSRTVTMDKSGTVQVECAIHPDMKMTIEIEK